MNHICSSRVNSHINITRSPFGAQEIYYTQNNHNDFNFLETELIYLGPQQHYNNVGILLIPLFLETPCMFQLF
jgi:hypothetical protein